MKITSPHFGQGEIIPTKFTCDGENINPTLSFSGIPDSAKSLVLIMEDPDAPYMIWIHWLLWNIPPTTTGIGEGEEVEGVVTGETSAGTNSYYGPCPPEDDEPHRYIFSLYALDVDLSLDDTCSKGDLEEAMEDHIIDQAELIGIYERV